MEEKEQNFELQRENNRLEVIKVVKKALKDFKPEQAILFMGRFETLEDKEANIEGLIKVDKFKYSMKIIECFNKEVYSKFITALAQEIIRLKALKARETSILRPH